MRVGDCASGLTFEPAPSRANILALRNRVSRTREAAELLIEAELLVVNTISGLLQVIGSVCSKIGV